MAVLFWFFYIAAFSANLYVISTINIRNIDLIDGVIIGQMYFIMIPLAFILGMGELEAADIGLTYLPYQDTETTLLLLIGGFLFPSMRFVVRRTDTSRPDTTQPYFRQTVILLFFFFAVVSFLMSGLASGGHWQGNLETALSENTGFVYIKHASNTLRTVVFGVLVYSYASGRLSKTQVFALGFIFSALDLFLTFNRITAVYYLISVVLILRSNISRLALLSITLPLLSLVSVIWPMFRGLATLGGYNLRSLQNAAETAQSHSDAASLTNGLNGVFESSNITVLNWIVENFGRPPNEFLAGDMFIRGLTILVPRSIWPAKPEGFGVQLGEAIANRPELALNSTMYGECFANFGWGWPIAMCVYILILHFMFRAVAGSARGVQAMGAFVGIAIWRFDSSFAVISFVIVAGIALGLRLRTMLLLGRRSSNRRVGAR
ncbi:hypothetical protein [Stakelama tenebrarum]|uniref:Oligosaccharide repeat unit polymerase n=1 Tax=Stakelama tenebrarum TaxID=2711215 RepID=A0A6G6Y3X9_9SPHN|nr:hypothetical protein [Sphingosinithalassobacter tenebrarum]QIG79517.1 hypothetical protein G5C33_06770 [Sphingosinithalassobacter tenebrarum]